MIIRNIFCIGILLYPSHISTQEKYRIGFVDTKNSETYTVLTNGNGNCHNAQLPSPVNDAADLADMSKNLDLEVMLDIPQYCVTTHGSVQGPYHSTSLSDTTIAKHFASHFGVLHNDPKYYHDQVELGAPWERTVVLTFDLNEIADGIRWTDREAYLAELDTFVMNAQRKGIWLMIELYVFRPIRDFRLAEEVLTTVAERYDHDGIDDMPFLKYPVKHFGVGNELAGTFKGTSWNFLAILEDTHNALTSANPEVKIVQAGLVPYHINQKDMLFWNSLFSMNVHEYIDIAVFHELQGRENFMNLIFYPTYFSERGLERPIWINELQFENTTEAPSLTQEQYAPIFIRYMTYALAHGTEKLFFANFKYPPPHIPADMPPPFTEASALIDSRDQRTILFNVVQTFIRRFDRFQSVEIIQEMIEEGEYPNSVEYIKIPVGQYKFIIDEGAYYILWGESELPEEIMGDVCVTDIFDHTVYMRSNEVTLGREPIYLCLDTK